MTALKFFLYWLPFLMLTMGATALCATDKKPNVILILIDDFGYECVGANGGTSYQTPHLDKLATSGTRFTHAYAQPLCTPTRVQLMTGLYNVRNYTRFGQLEPSQITFGHLFQQAGYKTCVTGKWQLEGGFDGPGKFGFDEYCLWQLTRRPPRYANPGMEINGRTVYFHAGEYGPDIVNDYAMDFITSHREEPFLLYYPMVLTHDPFQPTPDSADWDPKANGEKMNRQVKHFADMTAYMDKMVGRMVTMLEQQGLRENTLILITGDNGTHPSVTSRMGDRIVKGGKGSGKDNGIHVPLIANWPGTIPGGRVCDDLIDTTDYLPTLCEAAGIALPVTVKPDGQSFLPQLRGNKGTPREWIYSWYADNGGAKPDFEFTMNQRFKLYRNGNYYDWQNDLAEEHPLNPSALAPEASNAFTILSSALDRFKTVRPASIAAQGGGKRGPKKP